MRYFLVAAMMLLFLSGCSDGDSAANGEGDSPANDASGFEDVIPQCSGDPWTQFSDADMGKPTPDSEAYVVPPEDRRMALADSISAFADESFENALTSAGDGGYELCRQDSDAGQLAFWLPETAGEGHARWVINTGDGARPLVVEAPHILFETDTLVEAREMFETFPARALLVNGGHRCANTTPSGCSGTTSVCGVDDELFRESDMAHTVESFFQVAHRGIATAYQSTLSASLHGMGGDGFSISNGTTNETETDSPVARLFSELENRFPEKRVTSCNAFGNVSSTVRLCGTTNVQGRQLNGSEQACTQGASQASDRFIHLEQNLSIRKDEANRESVIKAFEAILP